MATGTGNKKLASITGSKEQIEEIKMGGGQEEPSFGSKKIVDREDDYHKRRHARGELSPEREDAFAEPTPKTKKQKSTGVKRSYRDIMEEQRLENEVRDVHR